MPGRQKKERTAKPRRDAGPVKPRRGASSAKPLREAAPVKRWREAGPVKPRRGAGDATLPREVAPAKVRREPRPTKSTHARGRGTKEPVAAAPSGPLEASPPSRAVALRAVKAGLDKKAENPTILDVRGLSSYADYVVLLSAESERQLSAIARAVEEQLRAEGIRALGIEGAGESGWVLIDFGDVVVHLFFEDTRHFYDLEGLWADAPRIRAPAA
ncbi:MAG: ribosome silencing factor [Deltaproteobacteria bacterium]